MPRSRSQLNPDMIRDGQMNSAQLLSSYSTLREKTMARLRKEVTSPEGRRGALARIGGTTETLGGNALVDAKAAQLHQRAGEIVQIEDSSKRIEKAEEFLKSARNELSAITNPRDYASRVDAYNEALVLLIANCQPTQPLSFALPAEAHEGLQQLLKEILESEFRYNFTLSVYSFSLNALAQAQALDENQIMTLTCRPVQPQSGFSLSVIFKLSDDLLRLMTKRYQSTSAPQLSEFFAAYTQVMVDIAMSTSVYNVAYEGVVKMLAQLGDMNSEVSLPEINTQSVVCTLQGYPAFSSLIGKAHINSTINSSLANFAVAPVQRLPRYEMFLKEIHRVLSKHLDVAHPAVIFARDILGYQRLLNSIYSLRSHQVNPRFGMNMTQAEENLRALFEEPSALPPSLPKRW